MSERINLLYIEDDDATADIMLRYLQISKNTNFNVTHKKTLKSALDYLDINCKDACSCDIDVILLDLILPNSVGVNTFKKIKKAGDFIPIVIISGHEDMVYDCVKLGAQDYLIKPEISVDLLERSIRYSIERAKIENEFKNVIRTSSLGYHMYKLKDDKLIFCGYNPASDKILGVDNSQFLNKEIMEAFPNLPPEIPKMYRRAIQKGEPWINQVVEYEDDNINHSFYRINAYKTAENHLTVTFEDITKQVTIGEALKRSEAKYRNIVEVTKAGICKLDYTTEKFVYVNDVLCRNFGWSREELLTMGPADVLTKSSVLNYIKRLEAIRGGEYIDNVFEYEAYKKDGSIFWGLTTAEYIEDENKNVIGANIVIIDITHQKIAEEELKKKEERIYSDLEYKIHKWREEITTRSVKKDEQLKLIDGEILSMTNGDEVL